MIVNKNDIEMVVNQTYMACGPICYDFYQLKNGTTLVTDGQYWMATSRSIDAALQDFDDPDTAELVIENCYQDVGMIKFK
jgi:hypothetical protein